MTRYLVLCAIPEGWERFDLWEPDAGATLAGRLDERLSEHGVGGQDRAALTGAAAAAVPQARSAGVLVWAIEAPAGDPAKAATLTVALAAVPGGGTGAGGAGGRRGWSPRPGPVPLGAH